MGSGNLGLVYLMEERRRLTLEAPPVNPQPVNLGVTARSRDSSALQAACQRLASGSSRALTAEGAHVDLPRGRADTGRP